MHQGSNDTTLALANVITSLSMDEAFHRMICLAKRDTYYKESGLVRLAPVIESYGYLLDSGILDDKDREAKFLLIVEPTAIKIIFRKS